MTNELILDIALVAGVAVFAIIGFIRGIQREIFTTAALLGGWAMASAWTQRWDTWLADLINISTRTSGFIITAGLVAGSLVILGWGAGGVVGSPPQSNGQRLAGVVLGGINAVLLASYALSTYTRYLSDVGDRRLIEAARIAKLLRDDYAYAIAGGMVIAVVLTIIALAIGGSGRPAPLPAGRQYPSPARKETLALHDDDYKVEPVRRSPGLDSTMPIAPVDPGWLSDGGGRRQQSRFQPSQSREWTQIPNTQATAPIHSAENSPGEAATTVSCVSCGRPVTLSDVYCPWCGMLTR
jgi:hypothetical protein